MTAWYVPTSSQFEIVTYSINVQPIIYHLSYMERRPHGKPCEDTFILTTGVADNILQCKFGTFHIKWNVHSILTFE
jgi:hypothetical protein